MTPPNQSAISICVPLRFAGKGKSYRMRNWHVCANELSALAARRGNIEIVAAEWNTALAADFEHITRVQGEGDFTRSRARNQAWRAASHDLLCFVDADFLMHPDQWDKAIEVASQYDACSPYSQFQRLGERKTKRRVIDWARWNWSMPIDTHNGGKVPFRRANLAGGIMFCTRDFMEEIGGWDEDFRGWGSEDTAVERVAVQGGFNIGYVDGDALHMHHPVVREGRKQTKRVWRRKYRHRKPSLHAEGNHKTLATPCPDYPSRGLPENNHPPITDFVAVTSLSPSADRTARQRECLATWKAFGLSIVAVQSPAEIVAMQDLYPQVDDWVASDGEGAPRINELLNVAIDRDQPILIVNSDIEIRGAQSSLLDAITPGNMTSGVRHNYDRNWWQGKRERWGIDAFYVEPEAAKTFPLVDLRIGKPAWDYWVPFHCDRHGIASRWIGYGLFFHANHNQTWSKADIAEQVAKINRIYGAGVETSRQHMPFGKHYQKRANTPPKLTIFIKTCKKDLPWLKHCLRSIDLFFEEAGRSIVLVADEDCRPELSRWRLTKERVFYVPSGKYGYLQQQAVKLRAHHFTSSPYVLFIDSDTIFTQPCGLGVFIDAGRPICHRKPYADINDGAEKWRTPTEAVVGEPVEYEYMRRMPLLYRRETLELTERMFPELAGQLFDGDLAESNNDSFHVFSEFNLLGAVADKYHPQLYAWRDDEPDKSVAKQYWSWGGLGKTIRDEIDRTLERSA